MSSRITKNDTMGCIPDLSDSILRENRLNSGSKFGLARKLDKLRFARDFLLCELLSSSTEIDLD